MNSQGKVNNNGWRKPRTIDKYETFEKTFYIFCEGTKTEPNYFEGIKKHIEKNPLYRNKILIEIEGVGANTFGILNYAIDYIAKNNITKADIWLVYDKDSFPANNFNGVDIKVQQLNKKQKDITYHTAWSNQCIEYWFILHFDYYASDNDRPYYSAYLDKKFKAIGYDRYKKNDPNIFKKLLEAGNYEQAIRFACKREKECAGLTPTQSTPATMVHKLVESLKKYFPITDVEKEDDGNFVKNS